MNGAETLIALQRYQATCDKFGKANVDAIIKFAVQGTSVEARVNQLLFGSSNTVASGATTPTSGTSGATPSTPSQPVDEMDVSGIKWEGSGYKIVAAMGDARNNGKSTLNWADNRGMEWALKKLSNGEFAQANLWIFVRRAGKIIAARGLDKVGRGQHEKLQKNIWKATDSNNPFIRPALRPVAGDEIGLCLVTLVAGQNLRTNVARFIWK